MIEKLLILQIIIKFLYIFQNLGISSTSKMKDKKNLIEVEKYIIKLVLKYPKILSGRKNYKNSYKRVNHMKKLIKNYFNL